MLGKMKKNALLHLLQYFLHCSGLELNSQCLWCMPVKGTFSFFFFFFFTENYYYYWWWSKENPSLIWNYSQFIWGKRHLKEMEKNEDRAEALAHLLGLHPSLNLTENASHCVSSLLSYLLLALPFPHPEIIYFLLSACPFHPTGNSYLLEAFITLRIHTSQLSILVTHLLCLPSISFVSVKLTSPVRLTPHLWWSFFYNSLVLDTQHFWLIECHWLNTSAEKLQIKGIK